jgi:glutathione synthase
LPTSWHPESLDICLAGGRLIVSPGALALHFFAFDIGAGMNFVFLMDPLATVKVDKDTSFIFMIGAVRQGHSVFFMPVGGLSICEGDAVFEVVPVTPQIDQAQPFIEEPPTRLSAADVDAVFIRTDPPFDDRYLMQTWLLDQLPDHIVVVNRPSGIRTVNEKVWTTQFQAFIPPTLVTSSDALYREFLVEHTNIIVKPANGFGGAGVFRLSDGDTNAGVVFETLTDNGCREVIVQKYVPAATVGDKRILLLDGEVLGAVLRVHGEGDHRNNFFAGGRPVATEVTARDQLIADTLAPHLRALGLYFVGIDVIGENLIEVNVTSPTCLQEMNRLYDQQLEDKVIAFVESLCEAAR